MLIPGSLFETREQCRAMNLGSVELGSSKFIINLTDQGDTEILVLKKSKILKDLGPQAPSVKPQAATFCRRTFYIIDSVRCDNVDK